MNGREIALENIISILEDDKQLHHVLKNSLDGMVDLREKSFVSRLSRGCVERKITLDFIIERLSNIKMKKMRPVIRNILRSGIYQIFYMDSVTDFAACNESVKLAVKKGFGSLRGFVNGVLRNACRKKDEISAILNDVGEHEPGIKYSVPGWIVEDFQNRFGPDGATEAFEYFFRENPVSIRCNVSICNSESFPEKITESGNNERFAVQRNKYIDYCFEITGAGDLERNKSFIEGDFAIQDFSSVLVGYLADRIFKSERVGNPDRFSSKVLDLCAAPGGKSLHMADMGYEVVSCDISERKLSLLRENASRFRFTNIKILNNDASVYNCDFEDDFDIVLCDLPCSGLGVIGRKPDLKYVMTPEKSTELSMLQKEILRNAVKYVKQGGILIYSTCTLRKCENILNADFIADKLKMSGIPVAPFLPKGIVPLGKEDNYLEILPGKYGSDGFFISCFMKK